MLLNESKKPDFSRERHKMPQDPPEKTSPGKGEKHTFTIFIPTYNRAHTLSRTMQSISDQNFRDFEVLVIDDGSTDDTAGLIESWQKKNCFPIKYVYQENGGKPAAHNRALEIAEGTFFITLDSDDSMLPDALEMILEHWNRIPERDRDRFAGVGGLCLKDSGMICGSPFPEDILDSNYLEMSRNHRLRGEKREAIRTEILRKYPYPIIEGEKHIRPSLILRRLSEKYLIRFINIPLQVNRHAPDGIMANRFKYRMKNPKGLRLCFLEEITLYDKYCDWKKLYKKTAKFVRYSLHSGVGILKQAREVKHFWTWLFALPEGVTDWMIDLLRKKIKGL